jgi:glycosyltransferase involved in cell wall biosynthesis
LFVPVSGRFGMGEYARALAIANGVEARWPGAAIHFMLSREAPYAAECPYPATLLESSPTFHSAAVIGVLRNWQPDVVIFDNAGRTAQLRAARRSGARVVYVSARRRQRRKAFRLRWMALIDEHWIAYPEFIAGSLNVWERMKIRLMRRPRVRYLDVVLARTVGPSRPVPAAPAAPPTGAATESQSATAGYVLVVPGGGTGHPVASDAPGRFLDAAREIAASGVDTVCVGIAAGAEPPGVATPGVATPRLRIAGRLPQADLAAWMRGARLIIANGGSTLLQAIASGKPCIAVPVAGDQAQRIQRCVAAGVAVAAPLEAAAMARAATLLLSDESRLDALSGRAIALGLADGVDVAVRALSSLLPTR